MNSKPTTIAYLTITTILVAIKTISQNKAILYCQEIRLGGLTPLLKKIYQITTSHPEHPAGCELVEGSIIKKGQEYRAPDL